MEVDDVSRGSPEERLKECSRWCQQQQTEQRPQCQSVCRKQYEEEKGRERGPGDNPVDPQSEYEVCQEVCTKASLAEDWKCQRKCERQQQPHQNDERERWGEREGEQPYVFEDQHFFTGYQTQHGRLRVLQKFTDRSRLLRGIENYRVAIFEAQPQTFIVPSHWDAESLAFVAKGRGTVSSVHQDRRESFNIREGDIFRVQAGRTTYLINSDNRERLVIVKLLQPVNTPGEFEVINVNLHHYKIIVVLDHLYKFELLDRHNSLIAECDLCRTYINRRFMELVVKTQNPSTGPSATKFLKLPSMYNLISHHFF